MRESIRHVCVATLGGQPQVITLALDRLFALGFPIDEVIVVHLSPNHSPRHQQALQILQDAFAGDHYAGRRCRYIPHTVQIHTQQITDITSASAADAVQATFRRLFHHLKQQPVVVHLCPTGGRRVLGMLALATSLIYFEETDRVWHLFSSDAVRDHTNNGAVLHLPESDEVQLMQLYLPTWGQYLPFTRALPEANAAAALAQHMRPLRDAEYARCQQVYTQLSERKRDVLRALAAGCSPQDTANLLCIELTTVHDYKTDIYRLCRAAWDLPEETRLTYHWLREKFAHYVAA